MRHDLPIRIAVLCLKSGSKIWIGHFGSLPPWLGHEIAVFEELLDTSLHQIIFVKLVGHQVGLT
jgi:hypothetical protein